MTDFNDFYWHDAVLLDFDIDRSSPGRRDSIKLLILWPNDKISTLEFFNCYGLIANMNFGMIALESILQADCFSQTEELDKIRNTWKQMGVNLPDLLCFRIETNTTASIIKIFALGFREIPHPEKSIDSYIRLGDTILVKQTAPQTWRHGQSGSVCGMRTIDSSELAKQFAQRIGAELYLIEFEDGETLEIPGSYLIRSNEI